MRRRIVVLGLLATVARCAKAPAPQKSEHQASTAPTSVRELVFLTREGCVNTTTMRINLDAALSALHLPTDYQFVDLATLPDTDARGGYPTPTLLYKNQDVFGMPEAPAPHPPAT